jgi:isopentenyldiphosphate isomerase
MALIPIVDEEDNIIDYKERDLLDSDDICRVSALWLTNTSWEILLAQRHRSKIRSPLCWWPTVAWTVEKDETYEENIIRESLEEIGLEWVEFRIGPKIKKLTPHKYIVQCFFASTDKRIREFVLEENEVEALRWITPELLQDEYRENPEKFGTMIPYMLAQFYS